jgi:hypothetical protein
MPRCPSLTLVLPLCAVPLALTPSEQARAATASPPLRVSPAVVRLDSPEATQQLLVSVNSAGRTLDLTRLATYASSDPKVAAVDAEGLVRPVGEGRTEVLVRRGAAQFRVPLEVRGLKAPAPISFETQVIPILTKAGCNSGGCHGKAEGQHGFKLSVFGFDPEADYQALVMEGRGRRVSTARPAESLLLLKGTAQVPHGGGKRLERGGLPYRRLVRWLAEGAQLGAGGALPSVSVKVEPEQQVLSPQGTQQLRVTAIDAQGNRRCVTTEAEYSSNAGVIADVDSRGLVQASAIPGEAAILVRYMGNVAVCRVTLPRAATTFPRPPEANFIDRLVWNKLQRLGIPPSDVCDDATFLRRTYLDIIGTLPTASEAQAFLAECAQETRGVDAQTAGGSVERQALSVKGEPSNPVRISATPSPLNAQRSTLNASRKTVLAFETRTRLVQKLLDRPEYADYWTMRWADILRVDKDAVTPQGAVAMTRWLRRQLAENRPYDAFVREIVTARGDTAAEGPASFYRVLDKPDLASRSVSQVFLGTRIECAQCHHHPAERWSQDDYYALAGFFTGVGRKKLPSGDDAIFAQPGTDLKHPRTEKPVPVHALGAPVADFSQAPDRRTVLADWMLAPENPFFARSIVNRLWAHYFGRGLVEPVDDLRATNPATNEPLLTALAQHLRELKYDLKAFTRTLLASRTYQLSSTALPLNRTDEQNFSHAMEKSLPAEVLLDAISQVTGVPEKFNGWPEGYRAVQIWDNRMPSYFFRIFGRPVRASVCECERSSEPSISQALHLMNAPEITEKLRARAGVVRRLAASPLPPTELVDELYLATLSRHPSDKERATMLALFQDPGANRAEAVEDALWALLNTKEFTFNH